MVRKAVSTHKTLSQNLRCLNLQRPYKRHLSHARTRSSALEAGCLVKRRRNSRRRMQRKSRGTVRQRTGGPQYRTSSSSQSPRSVVLPMPTNLTGLLLSKISFARARTRLLCPTKKPFPPTDTPPTISPPQMRSNLHLRLVHNRNSGRSTSFRRRSTRRWPCHSIKISETPQAFRLPSRHGLAQPM